MREKARTTLFTSKLSDWRLEEASDEWSFASNRKDGYLMGVLMVAGSAEKIRKLAFAGPASSGASGIRRPASSPFQPTALLDA